MNDVLKITFDEVQIPKMSKSVDDIIRLLAKVESKVRTVDIAVRKLSMSMSKLHGGIKSNSAFNLNVGGGRGRIGTRYPQDDYLSPRYLPRRPYYYVPRERPPIPDRTFMQKLMQGGRRTSRNPMSATDALMFGGNSGRLPSIARAAGIGGGLPVALGSGLIAGSAIAATATIVKSIQLSRDFEMQLGAVSRVAGMSAEQTALFGAGISDLAQRIPVATKEMMAFANVGANAGLSPDQLLKFTTTMAKISTIQPNLTEAQISGTLRIAELTKFPIERIDELTGAMVTLQQQSKATFQQLTTVGQRVSQDVGIFGASTQQVLGLSAAIVDLGLQPERASTALGAVVGKLVDIDRLGSDVIKNIISTFRQPMEIEAFRNLARENPVEALKLIGEQSVNTRKALRELQITGKQNVIVANLMANIDRVKELESKARLSADIIDKQLLSRLEELDARFKMAGNSFAEGLRKKFGEPLKEAIVALDDWQKRAFGGGTSPLGEVTGEVLGSAFSFKNALMMSNPATLVPALFGLGDASTKKSENIVAVGDAVTNAFSELAPLYKQAKAIADLGSDISQADINKLTTLDIQINEMVSKLLADLIKLGVDPKLLAGVRDRFPSVAAKHQTEKIKADKKAKEDRAASDADESLSEAEKTQKKIDELVFSESLVGKPEVQQKLMEFSRSSNERISDLFGAGRILNSSAEESILKRLSVVGFNIEGVSLSDIISKGETNRSDILKSENGTEILTLIDRLKASEDLKAREIEFERVTLDMIQREGVDAFKKKYDEELEDRNKKFDRDKENILQSEAPAIDAILDVGKAVELLNQQKNTTELQAEQLRILDEQKKALLDLKDNTRELIEEYKKSGGVTVKIAGKR